MIPIKIQCGCGQRYAFDIEPVDGRMGTAVACPVCGADGTDAANEAIAQTRAASVVAIPASPAAPVRLQGLPPTPAVRVAHSAEPAAAPGRRPTLLPGQLGREQAENEARARVSWGDSRDEVVKFLMRQGITAPEAQEMVDPWFRERVKTIRRNGVVKAFVGVLMLCAPVVFLIVSLMVGTLLLMPFAVTIMIGFWGLCKILKGIFMFFAPKSERGDVAEQ